MAIQYDTDKSTLFYIDKDGTKISATIWDGQKYSDFIGVFDAQSQAARDNTQAVANYNTTLANDQLSVSSGRDVAAPPKPLKKLVSDTGDVTYAPFDPPLADLVPYKATPAPSTGSIVSAVVPADKNAAMYNMVLAIFNKLFPKT